MGDESDKGKLESICGQSNLTMSTGASSDYPQAKGETVPFQTSHLFRSEYTFATNGDRREQEAAKIFKNRLKRYEEYWRVFIVPATNRPSSISLKESLQDEMYLLCQFHYSVLSHLMRAHRHLQNVGDNYVDGVYADFYSALQSSSENFEMFLFMREIVVLGSTTLVALYERTDKLANVRKREEYLKELEVRQLPGWSSFSSVSTSIAHMRNRLCHGPEVVTLTNENHEIELPRIEKYKKLLWQDLPEADRESLKVYFIDPEEQMKQNFNAYVEKLNGLYGDLVANDEPLFAKAEIQRFYESKTEPDE